jgi:hypothetical protein
MCVTESHNSHRADEVMELIGFSVGRTSRSCLSDGDAGVDCDHLCEDVKYRLRPLAKLTLMQARKTYLGDRLVVDGDKLSRLRINLKGAVEAQGCVHWVCACELRSVTVRCHPRITSSYLLGIMILHAQPLA